MCPKWKNIDIGAAYYYITGTFTEWLPLFNQTDIRELACGDIKAALIEYNASLAAYVIMPDHVHMLAYLPEENLLHKFNKKWRGRSGRRIPTLLEKTGNTEALSIMAAHANGDSKYATWKEQPRALPIYTMPKLTEKINYIHNNPVRRGLVSESSEWQYSSFLFYETGVQGCLPVEAFEP